MPVTTVQMYEIPTSALTGSGTVQDQLTLTITDDDALLHTNNTADPGTDQTFTSPGHTIGSTAVQFYYTFSWIPPGETQPVMFDAIVLQLTVDGVQHYYMIAEFGSEIPDLAPGATITLVSRVIYATPVDYAQLTCFVAGTLIETDGGPRPVEEIRIGDLVLTEDHGLRPVRWAGAARVAARDLARRPELRPIRVSAGALGPGVPQSDLFLSPQHRLLLTGWRVQLFFGEDEVLAPVKQLLRWPGVDVVPDRKAVTYHHLMFDAHEVIRANGAPAESFYLGDGIRDGMEREQIEEILTLFPELAARAPDPARQFTKSYEVAAIAPG